jgi:hypothetical protein
VQGLDLKCACEHTAQDSECSAQRRKLEASGLYAPLNLAGALAAAPCPALGRLQSLAIEVPALPADTLQVSAMPPSSPPPLLSTLACPHLSTPATPPGVHPR